MKGATRSDMRLAKFTWRRFGAALALGLLVEGVLLVLLVVAVNSLPQQLADVAGECLQLPGSYVAGVLAKAYHPGFEEQVGYILLIPLIQWPIYSTVIYIVLARRALIHRSGRTLGIRSRTASPK